MIKRLVNFRIAIIAILMHVVFSSFALFDTDFKIGLLIDSYSIDRWYKDPDFYLEGEAWYKDVDFLSERIDELNGETLLRVAKGSHELQYEQAKELVDMGVDALIVVAVNPDKAGEIVEYAHSKGVKVVAYDRMIKDVAVDCFVAYDMQKAAELQASYVLNRFRKGNYMFINGPKNDLNYELTRTGYQNIIGHSIEKEKIHTILDTSAYQSTSMEGYLIMEDYLSRKQLIPDVIIAANDELAAGVIMALDNHKLSEQVIVAGQNADLSGCRNIAANKQAMTVYKPIEALSYAAAQIAVKFARNEPLLDVFKNMATRMSWATKSVGVETKIYNGHSKIPSILVTPILIDKKNILETIVADGHLSEEDIYDK